MSSPSPSPDTVVGSEPAVGRIIQDKDGNSYQWNGMQWNILDVSPKPDNDSPANFQMPAPGFFTRFNGQNFEYPLPTQRAAWGTDVPDILGDVLSALRNQIETQSQFDFIMDMFRRYESCFNDNAAMARCGLMEGLRVFSSACSPPPTVFTIGAYEIISLASLSEREDAVYTLGRFMESTSKLLTTPIFPSQKYIFDAAAEKLGNAFKGMVCKARDRGREATTMREATAAVALIGRTSATKPDSSIAADTGGGKVEGWIRKHWE